MLSSSMFPIINLKLCSEKLDIPENRVVMLLDTEVHIKITAFQDCLLGMQ